MFNPRFAPREGGVGFLKTASDWPFLWGETSTQTLPPQGQDPKPMAALSLRRFSLLLTLTLGLTCAARGQAGGGSVRMSGDVSETVVLSIPQTTDAPGVVVSTSRNSGRALTVSISGATRELTELRIPVQIRSNTSYRLAAYARSGGSNLSSLLVVGARPTGTLAASDAAEALSVADGFDGRGSAGQSNVAGGNRPNLSASAELLSGPRVSLGGTLQSPQNALEVVLSLTVEPQADVQSWTVELLLLAAPAGNLP